VKIKVVYNGIGWVGLGVSNLNIKAPGSFRGSIAAVGIIADPENPDTVTVTKKLLINPNSVPDAPFPDQNLRDTFFQQKNGISTLKFTVQLDWNCGKLPFKYPGYTNFIFAHGKDNTFAAPNNDGVGVKPWNLALCLKEENKRNPVCDTGREVEYDQHHVIEPFTIYSKLEKIKGLERYCA